jgi:tripartite-type tricarboxylate transporter receptor subunit TctC
MMTETRIRTRTAGLATALAAGLGLGGAALAFPDEPLRIVVGFGAGGSTDTNARALARIAETTCGTTILVSNQPGGSGVVALQTVRTAAPDGYTIATTPTEISALSHMGMSDVTHQDFSAVMRFILDPHGFFVRPDSPYGSMAELIEAARGGATVRVATSGPASPYAVTFEQMAMETGVSGQLVNIPYQGDAEAIPAALRGEVDLLVTNASNVRGQVASGDLVPLGVANAERVAILPDAPTLIEQGIDVTGGSLYGLAVPAGTPRDRVERLGECFTEAFESDEFQAFLAQGGMPPAHLGPEAFDAYLAAEFERYGELLDMLGLSQR